MNTFFSKEDTKIIKGVAILFMLMHHLWGFPDRIAGDGLKYAFHIFGQSSIQYFGSYGKICVSLFFFLGGYGIYISSLNRPFDIISRIKKLYISYWKVFIIFIPIAFIFFSKQPLYCKEEVICFAYNTFSWNEFLLNLLGLSSSYNREWWFFISYTYAIITFPIIKKIIDKFSTITNLCGVVIGSILITYLFPTLTEINSFTALGDSYLYRTFFCQSAPYIACFWIGCVFAKDNLLLTLKNSLENNKLLSFPSDIIIILCTIYLRNTAIGSDLDILYVPVIIICILDVLNYIKIFRKIFLLIGNESTNMWLIHSFYCYYFYIFVKIIIFPRYAILSLLLLVVMSYFTSLLIDYIWKKVNLVMKWIVVHKKYI